MFSLIINILSNKKVAVPLLIVGAVLVLYTSFSFWLGTYTKSIKSECVATIKAKEQSKQIEAFKNRKQFEHENKNKSHNDLVNELRSRGELRD